MQIVFKMKWILRLFCVGLIVGQISPIIASRSTPYSYNNLIQKYSDSSKFLTIKQLQTLLDKIHTFVNETDPDSNLNSDPKCEHAEMECGRIHQGCLTAKDLFAQLNIQDGKFDSSSFEYACPLILAQVESNACNAELLSSDIGKSIEISGKPSPMEVWGLGLLFVTIISLCSLIGVSVMPLMEKTFYKQLLTVLIGLAVGSLSASSIFHLIPQAFSLMDRDVHHIYLNISLIMWFGIWFFFMTERILKVITDARQRSEYRAPEDTSIKTVCSFSSPLEQILQQNHEQQTVQLPTADSNGCIITDPGIIYDYQKQAIKASFGLQEKARVDHSQGHEHVKNFQQGRDSAIATVAWMVIFGDGLHNFIDGLSIGAAFNESILTGISISLAVLCEEFPHELGDFAVLLNAGMTMRQALLYNFLSACTCYLGLIVGIVLGEIECSTSIFGFAAGMFLYISLVDMVPEMNEVAEEASKVSVKKACITLLLQNLGMGTGMFLLYALARYQDNISFM